MPKAELHVHLEGAWDLATLVALARKNRVTLPADDVDGLRRAIDSVATFEEFVRLYVLFSKCLREPADFQRLVLDFMREQARQNVRWTEAHFTIGTHVMNGGNAGEIADAMWDAIRMGERTYGVQLRLIPDIVRNVPYKWADLTVEWALDHRDRGVVALGLSGIEKGYPATPFTAHFAAAREAGLHCVAHAGEHEGPASVREALAIGAERIGHGIRVADDPQLVRELADRRVPLEICPTSNLRLRACPSLAAHPLRRLDDEGVLVTIGSDDPTFFASTLSDEYARVAEAFDFDRRHLARLARQGVEAAFLPEADRAALAAEIEL